MPENAIYVKSYGRNLFQSYVMQTNITHKTLDFMNSLCIHI